jgi:hypothetical protein
MRLVSWIDQGKRPTAVNAHGALALRWASKPLSRLAVAEATNPAPIEIRSFLPGQGGLA